VPRRKAAAVEKTVQEERPELVVRGEKHEAVGRPTPPLQAAGRTVERELLVAAVREVVDDVQLDPAVVRSVVCEEKCVRPVAAATQASVSELREFAFETREITRGNEDVDVSSGRAELRFAAQ